MSHLLYYWRGDNYRRDLDFGVGYHLNQASARLHQVHLGESVWAFTRRRDGTYVLAARLVAKAKTRNQAGFRYGRYRVWGDLQESRYFSGDGQPDISDFVRDQLAITAKGDILGRSFQGAAAIRVLNDDQHHQLLQYSASLMPEPRARLIPEERLEALLLLQDADGVKRLLTDEDAGLAKERQNYLFNVAPTRNQRHVNELRDMYAGICQITWWDPRSEFGLDLCEAHHIRWLSRGGSDDISNMLLIAPNIHRAIHSADAPFDWERQAFVFDSVILPIFSIDRHTLLDS